MTPRRAKMKLPFARKLVLQQWALGELSVSDFADLAKRLSDAREGLDESNVHWFHHELCRIPHELRSRLPNDLLLAHDQSIV